MRKNKGGVIWLIDNIWFIDFDSIKKIGNYNYTVHGLVVCPTSLWLQTWWVWSFVRPRVDRSWLDCRCSIALKSLARILLWLWLSDKITRNDHTFDCRGLEGLYRSFEWRAIDSTNGASLDHCIGWEVVHNCQRLHIHSLRSICPANVDPVPLLDPCWRCKLVWLWCSGCVEDAGYTP